MSTIFGHGRLRLYLLKLLDESPRHGYEIISLLRDRFLGVYSPSPGTIYPRLARLEEEGLVTHEEVDGRKVYRLTDKGREELRSRSADLDDLEREITDSVRDVADAVREDVRDTISSLRAELKTGRSRGAGSGTGSATSGTTGGTGPGADSESGGTGGGGEDADSSPGGRRWTRDWERFTQGWGAWGKRGGERPEFDQALREFTDRVRGVVREAGQVGESAATDLRRILDDTFETIRRDVGGWGPRGGDESDRSAGGEDGDGERPGPAGGEAAGGGEAPSGRPGDDSGERSADPGDGSAASSADPWSSAVDDDDRPGGQRGDRPAS
ncbi:PadR family transcriptional regulator [Streptomonospora salina]|uniref:DNA-binding PadR family transcriptional regulator n=1 Tax=Streptomonospora salina TaxID=104205 RepID=A0A841E9E2_9ACTN|nr:PadR family transcriptional regulator [Streptomonospora salina]MBB5997703.1 DNA-binding PadR family transcriptional regulator [Streptomonospora salina]